MKRIEQSVWKSIIVLLSLKPILKRRNEETQSDECGNHWAICSMTAVGRKYIENSVSGTRIQHIKQILTFVKASITMHWTARLILIEAKTNPYLKGQCILSWPKPKVDQCIYINILLQKLIVTWVSRDSCFLLNISLVLNSIKRKLRENLIWIVEVSAQQSNSKLKKSEHPKTQE